MRIALSPNLRIAAGLLLAALLSIVGYQVFRRWISHGPEALLKRADDLSWLNSWIQAVPLYRQAEKEFTERHQLAKALYIDKAIEANKRIPYELYFVPRNLGIKAEILARLSAASDFESRVRVSTSWRIHGWDRDFS
ncbi:MAG TPA: hypothetical protein VG267_01240 [Terracidiphilus sp.]|jgi:hypothetical protein|nr:hypothetical protein [Terracidiphilus sp.]